MKCLNMKISGILLFMSNFMTIYQLNIPQDKKFQKILVNERVSMNEFDKVCPQVSKLIYRDIVEYTINCKPLKMDDPVINEETVLQNACFMVKDILHYICQNNLNTTADLLKIDNYDSICPFNFSQLNQLGFKFRNPKAVSELTQKDHCSKVCSDLYSNKTQCILLSKLNNYLKNITSAIPGKAFAASKVDTLPAKFERTIIPDNTFASLSKEKKEKTPKIISVEVTGKEKLEIDDSKLSGLNYAMNATKALNDGKKTEKLTTTSIPTVEQKLSEKNEATEGETKVSENENHLQEDSEIKSKKEDPNEEEQVINENNLSSLDEALPDKTDLGQVADQPKINNLEDKIGLSPRGKEIYSGEGFFQAEDSHFFFYFIMVSSVIVLGYLAFHNKNKILAYALEGTNGRRNRRRPNPARYRKLETNLEEVISSNATNTTTSSVVY